MLPGHSNVNRQPLDVKYCSRRFFKDSLQTAVLSAALLQNQTVYADSHELVTASQSPGCEETFIRKNREAEMLLQHCSGGKQRVTTARLSGAAMFSFDKQALTSAGARALQKLINDLRDYRQIKSITVVGHSDSRGQASYNQVLSEERARYVVELFSVAFPGMPVSWTGKGESEPIASNQTVAGRNKNRRVDITVIATTER